MNKFILSVIFIVSFFGLKAQNPYFVVTEDFEWWTEVEADHSYSKKWDGSYTLGARFDYNASQIKSFLAEYAIERDLKKKFDCGAQFRATYNLKSTTLRFSPFLTKTIRLKPINFNYRLKNDFDNELKKDKIKTDSRLRNKFEIEYKRKKHDFSPSIYLEIFHNYDWNQILLGNLRAGVSFQYELSKSTKISASYSVQQEQHVSNPVRDYILRTKISYSL